MGVAASRDELTRSYRFAVLANATGAATGAIATVVVVAMCAGARLPVPLAAPVLVAEVCPIVHAAGLLLRLRREPPEAQ